MGAESQNTSIFQDQFTEGTPQTTVNSAISTSKDSLNKVIQDSLNYVLHPDTTQLPDLQSLNQTVCTSSTMACSSLGASKGLTTTLKEKETFKESKPIFNSTDWMVGMLLMSLVIVALVKVLYGKYFSEMLQAIYDYKVSEALAKKKNLRSVSFLLSCVFSINISLFGVQILDYYHIKILPTTNFSYFIVLFVTVLFIYLFKRISLWSLGLILKKEKIFKEYTHNLSLFNKAIGLVLFPFVLALPFITQNINRSVLFLAYVVIAALYLMRTFRSLKIIHTRRSSLIYTILYVCTLEIAPTLVLIRLIRDITQSNVVAQILSGL